MTPHVEEKMSGIAIVNDIILVMMIDSSSIHRCCLSL